MLGKTIGGIGVLLGVSALLAAGCIELEGGGGAGASGNGSGSGSGGSGGSGGALPGDPCGPICDVQYPPECAPLNCPVAVWAGRFGTNYDQRVNAIAADSNQIAFVGQYVNTAFDIGIAPPTMQIPASTGLGMGEDAYLAVLDSLPGTSGGEAKWALPIDVGERPRAALGVAIDKGSNYLVTGYASGIVPGVRDAFVVNMNPSTGQTTKIVFGGDGDDQGVAIASDGAGGSFVLGSSSASTSVSIACGGDMIPYIQGMFVAHFDKAGACMWMRQFEGKSIRPTAMAASATSIWVTGWFSGTMNFTTQDTVSVAGAENMFVLRMSPATGDIVAKSTYGASQLPGAEFVRGNSITIGPGVGPEVAFVGGYLRGKTALSDQLADDQSAAFVASFDLDAKLLDKVVYPSTGNSLLGEEAYGTAVGFVNGNLYLAGTISGPASIGGFPTNTQGSGNNPFLAQIDPTTGSTRWVHIFDGEGESFEEKSFHMAIDGVQPVVAGSWSKSITFPGSFPLEPLGSDGAADIVIAKFSP